jgi:hypothetical protein
MATTFSLPDEDMQDLLAQAIERWHRRLLDLDRPVRVGLLVARNAGALYDLTVRGAAVAARVRVIPLDQRMNNEHDAEIQISRLWWNEAKRENRLAVIDHELCHLALVRKDGRVQYDDLGRPRLRLRHGDWDVGDGFAEVVQRHGIHAQEYRNMESLQRAVDRAMTERMATLFDDLNGGGDDAHASAAPSTQEDAA